MSSLTSERDTRELLVGSPHYTYEREAAAAVYAGGIVAQNASGKAVPASDAAFPTPVGVFLAMFRGETILIRLPHARGGVSHGRTRYIRVPSSSPRPAAANVCTNRSTGRTSMKRNGQHSENQRSEHIEILLFNTIIKFIIDY